MSIVESGGAHRSPSRAVVGVPSSAFVLRVCCIYNGGVSTKENEGIAVRALAFKDFISETAVA
jgi:hypothetical protein